jgi:hypothetical protein
MIFGGFFFLLFFFLFFTSRGLICFLEERLTRAATSDRSNV